MNIKFEVCCGCTEDAVNAAAGGADRIELNSALFLGGLTPSLGTLSLVKRLTKVPVMAMVRPREGGFCYTETEYLTMKEDARLLLSAGADGLVFGFLYADGSVDKERTCEFVALCGGKEAVFSRAIDLCPNILASTRLLNSLGICRVLTSGGTPSAIGGTAVIGEMVRVAGGMEILPGGGVNPDNAKELVTRTGVTQVHASARKLWADTSARSNPKIFFGGNINGQFLPEDEYKITDPEAVRKMKLVLDGIVHEK